MAKYLVWCPELGGTPETGQIIVAYDANVAACHWAAQEDRAHANRIASGGSSTLMVRGIIKGDQYEMVVTGTLLPHYTAKIKRRPE